MPWYVVSYDVRGNDLEETYHRIGNALRATSDWCKPLLSQWIVESSLSPKDFVDNLSKIGAITENEGLIVLETSMRGEYRQIRSPAIEWLQDHVTAY